VTSLQRLIPVEDLPASLWSHRTLYLAPALATAYCESVRYHGLQQRARSRDSKKPPVGGPTEDAADEHFAQAFDGSIARTALAFLDPKSDLCHVADALAKISAGGRIAVLDLPSGAGAFSLAILCTLAELRACGVVPRQPLEVVIVGGEFNPRASQYANDLHERLKDYLAGQAIHVIHTALTWDVCKKVSTTELIRRFIVDASEAEQRLVGVSNFSAFLVKERKQREAEPQLEEIFRFCSGSSSTALWLEPTTNAATENLFAWVIGAIKKLWRSVRLPSVGMTQDRPVVTQSDFALPLEPGRTAVARLSILRFELRIPS
jgi:hypothetical protein